MKKPKKVFVDGPIAPEKVAKSLASHSTKMDIDGHSIFLRQVKNTQQDNVQVKAIDFSVDVELAEEKLFEIREDTFSKFSLTCMHIYHSLGIILVGQLYFFVFTSSTDQKEAMKACDYLVDRINAEVQILERVILPEA